MEPSNNRDVDIILFIGQLVTTENILHVLTRRARWDGWIVTRTSCHIQPVKIDEARNLTRNGDPVTVAITQANHWHWQAFGTGRRDLTHSK